MRAVVRWFAVCLLLVPRLALAQATFSIVDLGVPPTWELDALGGVNAQGMVAGSYATAAGRHAFVYDAAHGGFIDLGTLGGNISRANDVNDAGVVVGRSTNAIHFTHAFRFSAQTGMQDIHSLVNLGGANSSALAVNEAGDIVGWADTPSGQLHAFLYRAATGQLTDLHAVAGWAANAGSIAQAVDDSGHVVAIVQPDGGEVSVFIHSTMLGSFVPVQTLGGGSSDIGRIVNGLAVGVSDLDATQWHAIVADVSGTVRDIGTLGGTTSAAADVNGSGITVGAAKNVDDETRAFVHDYVQGMRDLNALLADPDWYLLEAQGINASGQIVGVGYFDGALRVFMLDPPDSVAPVLSLPTSIVVDPDTPAGAVVAFSATASDNIDGDVPVTCVPPSGSTFAIGPTLVSCSAVDQAGNTGTGSFTVFVRAHPVLSWAPPSSIVVGTPLSALQLNATASVPGSFAYAPPLGTVLSPGTAQILSVVFTPANSVTYTSGQAQVTIDVLPVPSPAAPAVVHAVGDLPGGPFVSGVRDATKVNGTIYAVGASAVNNQVECLGPNVPAGCVPQFNADTAVLWTWNGSTATLTALPDLVSPSTPPVNPLFASAITRDAASIASQARSSATSPSESLPVRVTRAGLVNLNLGAAPFPTLPSPGTAQAISEDGAILYGVAGNPSRARRVDVNSMSTTVIPLLMPAHTSNVIAGRGTSFDGGVAVGTSFQAPFTGTNGRAFRYVHGNPVGSVSAIPLLAGGTWNKAIAVSPDGRLTLVGGNSTFLPNGEVYLYDASTGVATALGSPNTLWAPANLSGMTADGSVVAAEFVDPTTADGSGHSYIRNAHGWFHLTTALAAAGVDLAAAGWENIMLTGISPDGTLVFGSGERNGNVEGFVAEFAPGYLASFDVPAVPQTDTSIVGVWTGNGTGGGEAAVFLADGTFFFITTVHGTQSPAEYSSGYEYGRYHWDASTGKFFFATLQDTNGSVGLSGGNGWLGWTASVSGNTLDLANGGIVLTRVVNAPGSIVGGWVFGDPTVADSSGVVAFLPDGTYLFAEDGSSVVDPSGHDGVEGGTYTWNPGTGATAINVTIDTTAGWGASNGPGTATATLVLSPDELRLGAPGDPNQMLRIADPQMFVPAITSALSASGTVGVPFNYTVTATHAASFSAVGLPSGLSIDGATGSISGIPAAPGSFGVTISATNSFNSTTTATLTITVNIATALAVANANGSFGGTTTLSATLTRGGTPFAGQQVSFSLNGAPAGTATTNGAGIASLSGVSLAGIAAGSYATGVQAAYAGDAVHAPSTGSAALTVSQIVPVITWTAPASITHGTPLGAAQLNASANVPGTFVYTPAAGTILPVGAAQTLSVVFTPADAVNYTTAQAQVTITVLNAPPVARNVVFVTQEATSNGGNLQASDLESDPVSFSIVTPPAKGTLTLLDPATGAFTYSPNSSVTGYDTFTFRAQDGTGASSTASGSVFIVARAPQWPGQTVRASLQPDGSEQTVPSNLRAVPSADGRFVAFTSGVDEGTETVNLHVYVHDRQTGQTTLASVAGPSGPPLLGGLPWITPDGRYVAFLTAAGGLAGAHPNATTELYLHDRQTGQTTRLNVASDGTPSNNGTCCATLSADGRYAAFFGNSTNLVAADTTTDEDVYLHDRQTGQTTLVSVNTAGIKGDSDSFGSSISADGRFIAFQSQASNLVPNDTNGTVDVFVRDLWTGQTTRVSVASNGAQGNGSALGYLSADGRYVVMSSSATNLVPGDTNGFDDLFVHDRQTGQTTRVSVASTGAQGNGRSEDGSITADGRFVAFRSSASNLVPGDTNGLPDDFVHDRLTGQTVRVNVASDGAQANAGSVGDENGCCIAPAISADGRSIVITSLASNLVQGDTNNVDDIFVVGPLSVSPTTINVPGSAGTHSVNVAFDYPVTPWAVTTSTPWITIAPPAGGSGNGTGSFTVAANPGGTPRTGTVVVALQTVTVTQGASTVPIAQNGLVTTNEDTPVNGTLTATDPDGDPIAFSIVAQPIKGTVTITNPATGAFTYTPGLNQFGGDSFTFRATASGESSNVATVSISIAPVNDLPVALDGTLDAIEDTPTTGLLYASDPDSISVTYEIASQPAHGTVVLTKATGSPLGGGTYVYTPNANYNGSDSFTFRALEGGIGVNVATVTITVAPVNDAPVATSAVVTTQEGIAKSGTLLATDVEGATLTFSVVTPPAQGTLTITDAATGAFMYTPNAGVAGYDTFTFQAADGAVGSSTAAGMVFIVASSPRWPGQTVRLSLSTAGVQSNGSSRFPAFSADGRYTAFSSLASNLVLLDTNGVEDIFVHDRQLNQTTRVSVGSDGTQANGRSTFPAISANGRYVAFNAAAASLGVTSQDGVYVHDRQTGTTRFVSVASDATVANSSSWVAALSADGRYVAFVSEATNLVAGDTNGAADVFVHDQLSGVTTRVSVASDGSQANLGVFAPFASNVVSLSADGRYVAFYSSSSNLVPGDTNGVRDVFVHDRYTRQTTRVSAASDGSQANGASENPVLSADASYVVFSSLASNLVPGDTNGAGDVFVHERATGQTSRVSLASDGSQANALSSFPALSADGRYITFFSPASNLAPGDSVGTFDVFVHDRATGVTTRATVASDGTPANNPTVFGGIVSPDGRFLGLASSASNLVTGDTNNVDDIFVVGGVVANPTAIDVPGAGGTRGVNVSFAYTGTPWTATTTDPWITIDQPAGGSGDGTVNFTVSPNLGATPRTGALVVALQTVTVTQGLSTTPIAQNGSVTTDEDTLVTGTLSATDPDGDAITFSIVGQTSHGTVLLTNAATGAFTYTPAANYHGPDSFTFQASAGGESSNIATVSITVTPINDAPVTVDGTLGTTEDTAAAGVLSAADADGDALTFGIVTPPVHGTAVITNAATGAYTYTPTANYHGADSFTFRVADAGLQSNVATVTISVAPVNDPPVATGVVITTQEGMAKSGILLATDADGGALTFSVVTPPAKGAVTITDAATGAFTYTPNAGVVGYDTFTFQAADGAAASSTATSIVFIVASSARWPGQTIRASVLGSAEADSFSSWPSLSADGRFVAFSSFAANFGVDLNGTEDVFVYDRQLGQTTRASVCTASCLLNQFRGRSLAPSISADGRYVTFSADSNGTSSPNYQIYLRDRTVGTTTQVSVASSGAGAIGHSLPSAISANGRNVAFISIAPNLVPNDTNGTSDVFVRDLQTGVTSRVSVASDGTQSTNAAPSVTLSGHQIAISADGRHVAFESHASNLVNGDTNGTSDVFVHDRQTAQTARISLASDGAEGNGSSRSPAISADGRYVAFQSAASNLAPGGGNGVAQVFVHDRQTGQTARVSQANDGSEGNGASLVPSISADGRYIAFRSSASNLAANDTNGAEDVFVFDMATGLTTRVSVSTDGTLSNAVLSGTGSSISADGKYVAFDLDATNLVAGDTNSSRDIFVVGGVSVSPTAIAVPAAGGSRSVNVLFDYPGTPWSATTTTPWITIDPPAGGSANGAVSFTVAPNPGSERTGTIVVALHTVTVTQEGPSAPVAQDDAFTTAEDTPYAGTLFAIDPNGDAITFSIVGQPAHGTVVLTNAATGSFTYTPAANYHGTDSFTFQASAAGESSNIATVSITVTPAIDAPVAIDGTLAATEDTAATGVLTATDVDGDVLTFGIVTPPAHGTVVITNAVTGAYTYTPAANYHGADSFTFRASDAILTSNVATATITVAPVNDVPAATSAVVTTQEGIAKSGVLQASDLDGDALTFSVVTTPTKGTLVLDDATTGAFTYTPNAGVVGYDTFTFQVVDAPGASSTATGLVFVVAASPRWPGQTVRVAPSGVTQGNGIVSVPTSISADGRHIALSSSASDLVPGDTNGLDDVFVHDRATGQVTRVNVASDGTQANGFSSAPSISADGRYVAFYSRAVNLVAGDANAAADVFVHDRQTGQTARISVADDGTEGNGSSVAPVISSDGRYVAFESDASNLVGGDSNSATDVFVHDRLTGRTKRVSIANDGTQANGSSSTRPAISADGRFVAFDSDASNLVVGDGNGALDIFVHDLLTGATTRASVSTGGFEADGSSVSASISADGRYVAFSSVGSTLVPGDTNGRDDVFVHDRTIGTTTRVSIGGGGAEANFGSRAPSVSADGRYVAFSSDASNLVPNDTNNSSDVFVHDREMGETTRVNIANAGTQGNDATLIAAGRLLSADGRFVAFYSRASTFDASLPSPNGLFHAFVAGGVSVSPSTIAVPGGGGSRIANVVFEYPGTSWTATTTTPWITIASPAGGAANGAANFTVAPNTGAARIGTLTVALQTVTVNQDAASAPVAQDGSVTTAEDTSGAGTLSATDPNGDALTYSLVALPSKGTVILVNPATGAFAYTPAANLNGADSFTFQANDGAETSNIATISVTITPVNDAPIAQNGTLTVAAGGSATGILTAADIESATLTYALVANGTKGSAVITNPATGAYTYTATAGASGNDTFTFVANDGNINSNVATVTVTIVTGNRPPVASNSALVTQEDRSTTGTLSASDPDRDRFTFRIVANGSKGTATITNTSTGRYTYVPAANATGNDAFTFVANDGQTDSAIATVSVSITPVNDPPVAVGASYTVARNTPLNGQLPATDVDSSALTYTIGKAPKKGTVGINGATGAFVYTPATGFTGNDSFTFKVSDGAATSIATISITVN